MLSEFTETIRFTAPGDSTIPGALQNLEMFASFQNVLFVFDNGTDLDLATYEYELYEESDIVNPNTSPYALQSGATALTTGAGNSSVFAVPVEGSYIDVENDNIVVQKNFFGRVRAKDTSGNAGAWTSIAKTDPSTPLIDSQYIVSLTADKIKAGEIESAAIILGGANPANTIIKSKTYDTSSGTQGWYIRGDGHFSLGGPNGITYNNSTITIGSAVQVQANLAADSITVGSGQNQLNINDGINGGAGGMTLGNAAYNYWYSNGNFRVGGASNYMTWNGSTLSVVGQITSTSGTIGGWKIGSSAITSANDLVTMNSDGNFSIGTSSTNKASITSTGDFTVIGDGGGSYGVGTSTFFGPWYQVKKGSDPNANAPSAQMTYKDFTFFTNTTGGYSVFIGGGNDNNNAFIDVGATGVTDNNSISCSGWFRSTGVTGWYNQTYGGGIFMQDSTFVRVYNGKAFHIGHSVSNPNLRLDRSGYQSVIQGQGTYFVQLVNTDTFDGAYPGGVEVGSIKIDNSGLGSSFNDVSDKRLKKNITPIDNPISILKNIQPVEFSMFNTDKRSHGFIAQDMYEVYPNIVSKGDEDIESPVDKIWSIDYSKMTPILTAAVKELVARVEELESRLV